MMNKPLFLRQIALSLIFTIGMVVFWAVLNTCLKGSLWDGMTISKSALTAEYCEFNDVDKLFHQSMNTYSNLAYFFFGILILQIAKYDVKNKALATKNSLEKFPQLSALMGLCFIYLSIGSAFFHASLTYLGQRVDMNGTYSISIVLLGIGLYTVFFHKIIFTETSKKLWILGLLMLIVAFLPISLMLSSGKLLPFMILLLLVVIAIHYFQFRKEKSFILAILGFILMILAVKIRTLDVQKINCDPHSLYQGHSVWHLLTAMSSFCSYAFFRFSKKNNIQP